jgi:hypothetical protein
VLSIRFHWTDSFACKAEIAEQPPQQCERVLNDLFACAFKSLVPLEDPQSAARRERSLSSTQHSRKRAAGYGKVVEIHGIESRPQAGKVALSQTFGARGQNDPACKSPSLCKSARALRGAT